MEGSKSSELARRPNHINAIIIYNQTAISGKLYQAKLTRDKRGPV